MYTLAQRLNSNWPLVASMLGLGLSSVMGLVWWVMGLGGRERLKAWVIEIESCEQDDAAKRITRGFKAMRSHDGGLAACGDLIGGLDQWRAAQVRIEQRTISVHRSGYPICSFTALSVTAFFCRAFEAPAHTWSGICVAGSALAFAWLLWCVLPLVFVAYESGLPNPEISKPETKSAHRGLV